MKRDILGICLSKSMLSNNLSSTFTHVRAYQKSTDCDELKVEHAYPQMTGKELLNNMNSAQAMLWRAEYICQVPK